MELLKRVNEVIFSTVCWDSYFDKEFAKEVTLACYTNVSGI